MAIDPSLIAAGAGLVSSFFGTRPKYSESQKIQLDLARRERDYATGIPGSDPQEQAALAQMRGQVGAEQSQQTGQYLGALPNNARINTANGLQNLASGQAADRQNIDMMAMMDWLNKRRQAMLGAAQIAGSVGPKQGGQQNNIPQLMGNLAQLYAQTQAMKAGQQQGGVSAQGGGGGGFMTQGTRTATGAPGGSGMMGTGGLPAAQSQPLTPITGVGGALHNGFDPLGGLMGQQQSPMPSFGQSTPALSAGPQSGAPGMLAPASGASAAQPLKPMGGFQLPSPDLSSSNWNQIQLGTFGARKKSRGGL